MELQNINRIEIDGTSVNVSINYTTKDWAFTEKAFDAHVHGQGCIKSSTPGHRTWRFIMNYDKYSYTKIATFRIGLDQMKTKATTAEDIVNRAHLNDYRPCTMKLIEDQESMWPVNVEFTCELQVDNDDENEYYEVIYDLDKTTNITVEFVQSFFKLCEVRIFADAAHAWAACGSAGKKRAN